MKEKEEKNEKKYDKTVKVKKNYVIFFILVFL